MCWLYLINKFQSYKIAPAYSVLKDHFNPSRMGEESWPEYNLQRPKSLNFHNAKHKQRL